MPNDGSVIGVSDHGGWAILVTVTRDGRLLDRRRGELVDEGLPCIPHHHEAQSLPMDRAVALVERVRASAERHAARVLDEVAADIPGVHGIALRRRQPLPPTIPERLKDYRARNVADWVMYRNALASAAEARGWSIYWFDPKNLNVDAGIFQLRSVVGAPWGHDHKLAMAAAVAAATALAKA